MGFRCAGAAETGKGNVLSAGARTCRWCAVRKGTAAAEKRCGGRAAEGRIVSKQPVAVDETAVTGCAFATRQHLLRSRSIVACRSEPVQPSGHCARPTLRAKTRSEEGNTAVEALRAVRPACELP